ncbi:MAG: DEAD/DEAH box helicase family protein, partial [Deltaproteobacteria bacterium]|nr:DEAD/DEAH box helicase family protein [Deltaproteobacteria bacterium]
MLDQLRAALRTHKSVLAVAPCGSGKTALATKMLGGAREKGKRSFFICHRAELIEQTAAAFKLSVIPFGYIAAGYAPNPFEPVQIVSIDTLKNRIGKIAPPDFCVWDEAHHSRAKGWAMVKNAYAHAHMVGLTATPERLDGLGLGEHYSHIVEGPTVKWLIDNEYLSDYKIYAAPRTPDLSKVHTKMGDYDKSELESVMDAPQLTGDAIAHYKRLSPGKRAVAFCVSV